MNIFNRSSLTGNSGSQQQSSISASSSASADNNKTKSNIGRSYASSFSLGAMKSNLTSVIDSTAVSISNLKLSTNKQPSETDKNLTKKLEQQQIKDALSLYLSDIRLHCPQTSNGIAVVSSMHTMTPLMSQHLKFTWYRLGSSPLYKSVHALSDEFYQVDLSSTPWYLPTIDDVGCNISVHCEDTIGEGLTHYVECGPIIADPLICAMSETAIENSFFEIKNVGVSLGVDDRTPEEFLSNIRCSSNSSSSISNGNGNSSNNIGGGGGGGGGGGSGEGGVSIDDYTVPQYRPSSLSKKSHYLDISGPCSVSISSDTLFISICKSLNNGFGKGLKFNRRGIGDDDITRRMGVYCTQPASVVLTVPIRKTVNSVSTSVEASRTPAPPQQKVEDMEKWLASSVLSIPWEYDGGSSPEAVAAGGHNNNNSSSGINSSNKQKVVDAIEEEQRRINAAEKESLAFANTVVSLAEFVASLPESVEELKFCFSCASRMDRDILAATLRGIFCSKIGSTKTERLCVLPWRQVSDDEVALVSLDVSSSSRSSNISLDNKDIRVILRALEEENVELKQEKMELTKEIMQHRELAALNTLNKKSNNSFARTQLQSNLQLRQQDSHVTEISADSNVSEISGNGSNGNNNEHNINNSNRNNYNNGAINSEEESHNKDKDVDGYSDTIVNAEASHKMVAKQDIQSDLATGMKIIELENKLKISAKKEAELQKSMKEIEGRSQSLMVEVARHKQDSDESKINLTVVSHEKESLLKRHNHLIEKNTDLEAKHKDIMSQLKSCESELANLRISFTEVSGERDNFKSTLLECENELVTIKALLKSLQETHNSFVADREKVTESYLLEIDNCKSKITKLEVDANENFTLIARQNESLQKLTSELKEKQKLVAELTGIDQKCNKLQGENNHLRSKADTKDKEIKRLMTENSFVVGEFDKALSRKQQESNELQAQIYALNDQLFEIKSSSLNLIKSFQDISIPNIDVQAMFRNINLGSIRISKDSSDTSTKIGDNTDHHQGVGDGEGGDGDGGGYASGSAYGKSLIGIASNIDISTPLSHMTEALQSLMASVLKDSPISAGKTDSDSDSDVISRDGGSDSAAAAASGAYHQTGGIGAGIITSAGKEDGGGGGIITSSGSTQDESSDKSGMSSFLFSGKLSLSALTSVLSAKSSFSTSENNIDSSVLAPVTCDTSSFPSSSTTTTTSLSLSTIEVASSGAGDNKISGSNTGDNSSASAIRLRTFSDSVQNAGTSFFRRLSLTSMYNSNMNNDSDSAAAAAASAAASINNSDTNDTASVDTNIDNKSKNSNNSNSNNTPP